MKLGYAPRLVFVSEANRHVQKMFDRYLGWRHAERLEVGVLTLLVRSEKSWEAISATSGQSCEFAYVQALDGASGTNIDRS